MNVNFTPDNVLISQNKAASKMFESDAILSVLDITGHFPEF